MPATAPRRVTAKAGHLPGKPNPRLVFTSQVQSSARSIGRRGKTDAVDARMLAVMASVIEDLRLTDVRSEA